MKHIKNILKKLDLTEKEIEIYIANLKIGTSSSSGIKSIVNYPQSTIKYTLELLTKKKLLIKSKKGITTYFTAEHPNKLKNLLIIKKNEIENTEKSIDNIMGDLIKLYNPYTKIPKVTFYEGLEEYKKLFMKVIESGEKEIFMIANTKVKKDHKNIKNIEAYKYEIDVFLKERVKKKIFMNLITTEKDFGKEIRETDEKYLRKTKFITDDFGEIENMIIYGDNIILLTDNFPIVGIAIKDKQLKTMFKNIFNFLWKNL